MQFSNAEPVIGFSTGALALSDWRMGIEISRKLHVRAIELSALRLGEFEPLVRACRRLDLSGFDYVSVHLPSHFSAAEESGVLRNVEELASLRWPLILHPDTVSHWASWRSFGNLICLENMDKRKPVGRTVEELADVFERLPDARFCFDYGHARQVDPTMSQAVRLLEAFGDRLEQIHFSDVDASNRHQPLNHPALAAFSRVRDLAPRSVPVILETLVDFEGAELQLRLTRKFFSSARQAVAS